MANYFEKDDARTYDFDRINQFKVEIYVSKRGKLVLDLLNFFAGIPWEVSSVRYYDETQVQIKMQGNYGWIVKYLAGVVDYDSDLTKILKGKEVRAYIDDIGYDDRVFVVID